MPLNANERTAISTMNTMKAGCDISPEIASGLLGGPGGQQFTTKLSQALAIGIQGVRTSNMLLGDVDAIKAFLSDIDGLLFHIIDGQFHVVVDGDPERQQWMDEHLAKFVRHRRVDAVRELMLWGHPEPEAQQAPEVVHEAADEPAQAEAPRFPDAPDLLATVNLHDLAANIVNNPEPEWYTPQPPRPAIRPGRDIAWTVGYGQANPATQPQVDF